MFTKPPSILLIMRTFLFNITDASEERLNCCSSVTDILIWIMTEQRSRPNVYFANDMKYTPIDVYQPHDIPDVAFDTVTRGVPFPPPLAKVDSLLLWSVLATAAAV
jgi:hypothetical protein